MPTSKILVRMLSKNARAYGLRLLYLAFPVFIAVACWSFLQTDKYRREAYTIISEVNEVQWRVAQIRQKTVSAMGWARLAQETGKDDYLQRIKRETSFLTANIQDLVSQDYASHVRHFALLFAHMTHTRINALHMYVHDTLNHTSSPDFKLLNMARQKTADLAVVNQWLTRIAYPKYDPDGTQIVSLDTMLIDVCKPNGSTFSPTVIADGMARQSLVPHAQFLLMLQELVRNAKDAVADRELPEIYVPANIRTGLFFRKNLVLSVQDNGVGMSPDHIKKATTPFFSSKGESSRNSGLGLTGCARLVETMHGRLSIVSELDKGTTVTISFPTSSLKNWQR